MILCDTGPLVAAFNKADRDHARCVEFLASNWSRLVIPSLAVTEICHLLADPQRRGRVGLAAEFCAAIADDELRVIEITPHDYRRMAELLTTYSSLRLQAVDACVIALAERLDLHEVAAPPNTARCPASSAGTTRNPRSCRPRGRTGPSRVRRARCERCSHSLVSSGRRVTLIRFSRPPGR